ncbi:MAG TPA: hypothetical protein VE665_00825, partial [Hyphomicrobiaceae bacterium]|nr:hypothetical protein [Hyphomicrobiaceae bacterium]
RERRWRGCIERSTRGAQIPIALMAPSRPTDRGFLPWRVSDDGPGASRVVAMGRHPKPFTEADIRRMASTRLSAQPIMSALEGVPVRLMVP